MGLLLHVDLFETGLDQLGDIADGAGKLLRMNRRSFGVMMLEPIAERLVSIVVGVCMIMLSACFQLT